MIEEFSQNADKMTLLVLNVEGDDAEKLSLTSRFCEKLELAERDEANYVHGAFTDDEPKAFEQFNMAYIPHQSVLSKEGKLMSNRVSPAEAIECAKGLA